MNSPRTRSIIIHILAVNPSTALHRQLLYTAVVVEIRSAGKQFAFLVIPFEQDLLPRTMCLNSTKKELHENFSSYHSYYLLYLIF